MISMCVFGGAVREQSNPLMRHYVAVDVVGVVTALRLDDGIYQRFETHIVVHSSTAFDALGMSRQVKCTADERLNNVATMPSRQGVHGNSYACEVRGYVSFIYL